MEIYRKVPFLSFEIRPHPKVKVNLAGCNFVCRGCFAIAKNQVGRDLSVKELINLITKASMIFYGKMIDDVQLTGGEPTMDIDYLLSLINELRKLNVQKIGISTNGYFLDKNLVEKLKSLNVNYIKLDIKAYTESIHISYTGKSNASVLRAVNLLNKYKFNFYVRTIFMPDLMEFEEIGKIARFISEVDRNINYKLYQFSTEHLSNKISRAPTKEEMEKAYSFAKKYLDNVEFYTTETVYKLPPYKCIEVRADELLDRFKNIDKISKSVIPEWNMEYFTMNQILNLKMT